MIYFIISFINKPFCCSTRSYMWQEMLFVCISRIKLTSKFLSKVFFTVHYIYLHLIYLISCHRGSLNASSHSFCVTLNFASDDFISHRLLQWHISFKACWSLTQSSSFFILLPVFTFFYSVLHTSFRSLFSLLYIHFTAVHISSCLQYFYSFSISSKLCPYLCLFTFFIK